MLDRLDQLYAIGGGPGANRVGATAEEDEAHRLAAAWMREAGLDVEVDPAGNLLGRLRGRAPDAPEIWTGSHLDSVPNGGRFDGALGVAAAIEAVERVGGAERTLTVVVFRDEERGCHGSRALAGSGTGLPGAFVELHVEQGPVLERADAPLGLVTAVVGIARGEATFTGRAGHA
ncbi:MAG: M20/M25/M40 family metallo-hydrolase, partial [Actinomycetota bacterium]|nr:M20/M25/M40 family metallo-hydrolase [Actinomycetota bacterium]